MISGQWLGGVLHSQSSQSTNSLQTTFFPKDPLLPKVMKKHSPLEKSLVEIFDLPLDKTLILLASVIRDFELKAFDLENVVN